MFGLRRGIGLADRYGDPVAEPFDIAHPYHLSSCSLDRDMAGETRDEGLEAVSSERSAKSPVSADVRGDAIKVAVL